MLSAQQTEVLRFLATRERGTVAAVARGVRGVRGNTASDLGATARTLDALYRRSLLTIHLARPAQTPVYIITDRGRRAIRKEAPQ